MQAPPGLEGVPRGVASSGSGHTEAIATYPTAQAGGNGSGLTEVAPTSWKVYIVSDTQYVRQAIGKACASDIVCDHWSCFKQSWKQTLQDRLHGAKLVWLQMPSHLNLDVREVLQALTHLLTGAQMRDCALIMVIKYSRDPACLWKSKAFRNWRNQHSLAHSKHCTCCYGVRYGRQAYHSRYNVLTSNIDW